MSVSSKLSVNGDVSSALERPASMAIIPRSLTEATTMAQIFAQSGYFQDARQQAQACVKILYGAELGIPPIAAMQGIHIVQNKPTISATLMAAMIKRSGKYDYRVLEMTNDVCQLEALKLRGGHWEVIGIGEFTRDDATAAGTQNMHKYPRNMLFARCISNLTRWYFPDLFISAVYVPEELGVPVDGEGNPIPPAHADDTTILNGQFREVSHEPSAPSPIPANASIAAPRVTEKSQAERLDALWRESGIKGKEAKEHFAKHYGIPANDPETIAKLIDALETYIAERDIEEEDEEETTVDPETGEILGEVIEASPFEDPEKWAELRDLVVNTETLIWKDGGSRYEQVTEARKQGGFPVDLAEFTTHQLDRYWEFLKTFDPQTGLFTPEEVSASQAHIGAVKGSRGRHK